MDEYQQLIARLGLELNVPDMTPDEDGYLMLQIDEQIVHMQVDADADALILYAILHQVESDRQLEIYARLLTANTFWHETGGATLSIDAASSHVLICRSLSLRVLDEPTLETALARFTDTVNHWETWLTAANAGGAIYPGNDQPGFPIPVAAIALA
ncbi:Tir chaperone protein (CesT) [compost metagenome]